ncbi:MAG: protease modulator HflC [Acetanaerobacterium sp.]
MDNVYGADFVGKQVKQADIDKSLKKAGKFTLLAVGIVFLLIIFSQIFYVVDETEHVIKYRFNEIVEVDVNNLTTEEMAVLQSSPRYQTIKLFEGAGLHLKIPFIERIERFDNRLITYDTLPREVITSDKKKIILDNNAQWWIVDPVQFKITMNTVNAANQRVEDLMYSKMNEKVGQTTSQDLISNKEYVATMLTEKSEELNVMMAEYGIRVLDIQIKRTDLPTENNENIYNRMRTEREQMARQYRSEGGEEAEKIKSGADYEAAKVRAEANAEAQRIRGKGDADAAEIYNRVYSKDPDFYEFYKTLETYQKTLPDSGAKIVISPDSEFAKYLYGVQ